MRNKNGIKEQIIMINVFGRVMVKKFGIRIMLKIFVKIVHLIKKKQGRNENINFINVMDMFYKFIFQIFKKVCTIK